MKNISLIFGNKESGKTHLMWEKLVEQVNSETPYARRIAVISDKTAILDGALDKRAPHLYSDVAYSNDEAKSLIDALTYEKNRRQMYMSKSGYDDFEKFRLNAIASDTNEVFPEIIVGLDNYNTLPDNKEQLFAMEDFLNNHTFERYGFRFILTFNSLHEQDDMNLIDVFDNVNNFDAYFMSLSKSDNVVIRSKKLSYYNRDTMTFGEYHAYHKGDDSSLLQNRKEQVKPVQELNLDLIRSCGEFYGEHHIIDTRGFDYSWQTNRLSQIYDINFFESLYRDIKEILTTNEIATLGILSKNKAYRIFSDSINVPESMRDNLTIIEITDLAIAVQMKRHKNEVKEVDDFLRLGYSDTNTFNDAYDSIEKRLNR